MTAELLGRRYYEALRTARQNGRAPERVRIICPPWPVLAVGELRVVGLRPGQAGDVWILAYTDYLRETARGK